MRGILASSPAKRFLSWSSGSSRGEHSRRGQRAYSIKHEGRGIDVISPVSLPPINLLPRQFFATSAALRIHVAGNNYPDRACDVETIHLANFSANPNESGTLRSIKVHELTCGRTSENRDMAPLLFGQGTRGRGERERRKGNGKRGKGEGRERW